MLLVRWCLHLKRTHVVSTARRTVACRSAAASVPTTCYLLTADQSVPGPLLLLFHALLSLHYRQQLQSTVFSIVYNTCFVFAFLLFNILFIISIFSLILFVFCKPAFNFLNGISYNCVVRYLSFTPEHFCCSFSFFFSETLCGFYGY